MKWPLKRAAVPRSDIPLYNLYYLHAPGTNLADPSIIWGTDVDVGALREFLQEFNRSTPCLVSTAHVLVQATAQSLVRHPELNRRVVGRRVFEYREIGVRLAIRDRRQDDVDVVLLRRANELSLEVVARSVWKLLMARAQGNSPNARDRRRLRRLPGFAFDWLLRVHRWLDRRFRLPVVSRLDQPRMGVAFVNDFSSLGAPPLRCYKPSRFPDQSDALNVTLGPAEDKVVVREGAFVVRPVAPLFVRADHRIVDAFQLSRFVATLRDLLQDPRKMNTRCNEGPAVEERAARPAA